MPDYTYNALDDRGAPVSGRVAAPGRAVVVTSVIVGVGFLVRRVAVVEGGAVARLVGAVSVGRGLVALVDLAIDLVLDPFVGLGLVVAAAAAEQVPEAHRSLTSSGIGAVSPTRARISSP